MRLDLITDVKELQDTWSYELLPGLFEGGHRNPGPVFVEGDAFGLLEVAFARSVPSLALHGPTTNFGAQNRRFASEA